MAKITEGTTGTYKYEGTKETFVPQDEDEEPEVEPEK